MDENWKRAIANAASLKRNGRGPGVRWALKERAGVPLSIRATRGSLFLIARQVLAGGLRAFAVEGNETLLIISLDDLVDILEMRLPTLKEGLDASGFKPAGRRRSER